MGIAQNQSKIGGLTPHQKNYTNSRHVILLYFKGNFLSPVFQNLEMVKFGGTNFGWYWVTSIWDSEFPSSSPHQLASRRAMLLSPLIQSTQHLHMLPPKFQENGSPCCRVGRTMLDFVMIFTQNELAPDGWISDPPEMNFFNPTRHRQTTKLKLCGKTTHR